MSPEHNSTLLWQANRYLKDEKNKHALPHEVYDDVVFTPNVLCEIAHPNKSLNHMPHELIASYVMRVFNLDRRAYVEIGTKKGYRFIRLANNRVFAEKNSVISEIKL